MVKLGSKVRDMINGFEGVAVARADYLYGCVRVLVEPQTLRDGNPIDAQWWDEQRLEVLQELPIPVSPASGATAGGPQRDPARAGPPKR